MSSELITAEAAKWTKDQIELVKRTVARGATDDELSLFSHVSQKAGLDPFAKQIYCIKRWDSKEQKEVMSIQTGIDGYRVVANRTGQYAGNDEPKYSEKDGKPVAATVTVYRLVDGHKCSFSATARWSEYVQIKKDGSPTSAWVRMPFLMLGKCAEALALRKAFPMELSGIYTHEEMQQADNVPLVVPDADPAPKTTEYKLKPTPPVNPAPPAPAVTAVTERRQEATATDKTEQTKKAPLCGVFLITGLGRGIKKDVNKKDYWGIRMSEVGSTDEPKFFNTYHESHYAKATDNNGTTQHYTVNYTESSYADNKTGEQKTSRWIVDMVEVS